LGLVDQWLRSYQVRLGVALASMLMVYYYPIGDMSPLYFIAVLLVHLASSFASTMMMVSQVHLNLSLSLSLCTDARV